jgi:hypothetical protein
MKVKEISLCVEYCNGVTKGDSPPLFPVTWQKNPRDRIEIDPEGFIIENLVPAMDEVGLGAANAFAAEEIDLVLRRIRQRYKTYLSELKKRLKRDGKDVSKIHTLKNEDLNDALILFLKKAAHFRLYNAQNVIRHRGHDSLDLVCEVINAWTGTSDPRDVAILAHWIWQIKRKLRNLPVKNHIMPILFGNQGGGKSEAVRSLLRPFEDLGLVLAGSVPQLTDDRYLKVLSDHYVFFADEMSHAEKADVNSLKNIITANRLNPRKLGTNSAYDIAQNCSFIGATNKSLNELIYDSAMRRFWQFECLSKMNWEVINKIDYLNLIIGIDENDDGGYLYGEVLDQVKAAQKSLENHDDLHHFLEEKSFKPGTPYQGQFISNIEIYRQYIDWTASNSLNFRHSKHEFLKRLKNRGFKAASKNISGKTQRGFWLSVSSEDLSGFEMVKSLGLIGAL